MNLRDVKFWLAILSIIVIIFAYPVAFYMSSETTEVTIKEKWIKYHDQDAKYLFSDMEENVYSIQDSKLLLKFDASDRYASIEPGQTYEIKTYGWRWGFRSWYKNAINIEKIA